MNRSENNRGAAMVIVLCVMVVFLALSATVLLSGSVALATVRNNIVFERGKAQAVSLSDLFARDMLSDYTEEAASLQHYVRNRIIGGAWPAYDEMADNKADAVQKLTMDSDGEQHQIEIELYWTCSGALGNPIDEKELETKDVRLFVEVISTLGDPEYRVKREFELKKSSESNENEETKSSYPCVWKWEETGRSGDR